MDNYQLILEMTKLKLVFRNTQTEVGRKESTAEHSWSVSMMILILMEELKKEFGAIDELKIIKLCLIHDVVEIYAGDVIAFDLEARKAKQSEEKEAMEKLVAISPVFGKELRELWYEFEGSETIESKIAKAADAICPLFQRLQSKQSYFAMNITMADMEKIKLPLLSFSKTFMALYRQLASDLLAQQLIAGMHSS